MEMKKLTCEMCNSTDVVKQDGFFVCQSCGTKYTVEEAKKMMVEGKVDVSGSTVKIDTSDELKKLYDLAHRAKADGNSENAQKYYEQIITMDPDSWEANFYTVYYQAMNCTIAGIELAANRVTNCQRTVLNLIKTQYSNEISSSFALNETIKILNDLVKISGIMYSSAIKFYNDLKSDPEEKFRIETRRRCEAVMNIMYTYGDMVIAVFGDEFGEKVSALAWQNAVALNNAYNKRFNLKKNNDIIIKYEDKILKYNTSYIRTVSNVPPEPVKVENPKATAIGCVIILAIIAIGAAIGIFVLPKIL